MARRPKSIQYVPLEERPEFIAAMAALPADPAELEVRAARVRQLYHDAMLAADVQALDDADLVYRACVVKLNGGAHVGSATAQTALEAKLAALPGQVPEWGQAGQFLLEVESMRLVVRMCPDGLSNHCGAELTPVDYSQPFVSKTGFTHQYLRPTDHLGRTVDQAVRAEVLELLASRGGRVSITDEFNPKSRPVWPWLADALAGVRPDGQLAMFGEAPKDPNAKKPLSNKERQKAFRERQRKLKEEQGMQAVLLDESERQLIYQWREQRRVIGPDRQDGVVPRVTSDRLSAELERLRSAVEELELDQKRKGAEIFALKKENALLESERNKAHKAIGTWENRLRAAGQSTDYRPLPGEQGHVTVTHDKD